MISMATVLIVLSAPFQLHAQQSPDLNLRIDREAAVQPYKLPALKPYQRIAVIKIGLRYGDGTVPTARLISSETRASIAPKVFIARGGDWLVTLLGTRPQRSFFVRDPQRVEVFPATGDEQQPSNERLTGPLQWDLIVPLYDGRKRLRVRGIRITDLSSGELILESKL